MADCSKILEYVKELSRMCKSTDDYCNNCPMANTDACDKIWNVNQEKIDIVQKWSDSHPIKTRQSEFLKMFPNAEIKDGIIQICPFSVDGNRGCYVKELEYSKCQKCRQEYWLEEIE